MAFIFGYLYNDCFFCMENKVYKTEKDYLISISSVNFHLLINENINLQFSIIMFNHLILPNYFILKNSIFKLDAHPKYFEQF